VARIHTVIREKQLGIVRASGAAAEPEQEIAAVATKAKRASKAKPAPKAAKKRKK